jgi:hypothetical protein
MHLFKLQPIRKILYTPIKLKFFSKDSTIEVMDRVDFLEKNEFHIRSRKLFGDPTTPTMITILLKTGVVKNEKQALAILLGIIAITLTLASILLYSRITPSTHTLITDQQGNVYTFEQYIELVRNGKDPLLPK